MIKIIDLYFLGHSETIASFLIETDEGPVLIETGPHSTIATLEAGLNANGYKLEEVQYVFLTHIHLDHGGAAWVFAKHGAKIYLHPLGKPHFQNPEKLLSSARRIYKDDMDRLWGDLQPIPEQQLIAVKHGEKIKIGKTSIKALHTPGHAIHHIAWQLDNSLFTGDVAGIRIGENDVVMAPCPPPDIDIEAWSESIRLIKSGHFEALYLTHFGRITHAKNHLEELEGRLKNWANWMKPYWEAGTPAEEITPIFQDYVARQLREAGVQGEDLEKYENANPSWMSVAGLLRYWKKHFDEKK